MYIFFTITVSILALPIAYLFAAEADYTFQRGRLPDVTQELNRRIQSELDQSMPTSGCSIGALHGNILRNLGGFGSSRIEHIFNDSPAVGSPRFRDSIYSGAQGETMYLSFACCADNINLGRSTISSDKLGHFLHSGFEMFAYARQRTNNPISRHYGAEDEFMNSFLQRLDEQLLPQENRLPSGRNINDYVFELSHFQEETMWGRVGTGVYSYGDIAAN